MPQARLAPARRHPLWQHQLDQDNQQEVRLPEEQLFVQPLLTGVTNRSAVWLDKLKEASLLKEAALSTDDYDTGRLLWQQALQCKQEAEVLQIAYEEAHTAYEATQDKAFEVATVLNKKKSSLPTTPEEEELLASARQVFEEAGQHLRDTQGPQLAIYRHPTRLDWQVNSSTFIVHNSSHRATTYFEPGTPLHDSV